MNKDAIIRHKVGLKLSQVGMLSKVFAMQSFVNGECNITPEQYTVLNALSESEWLYQRQISAITLKDRANITRIINILEKRGYIKKVVDTTSRKIHKIYITEEGKKVRNKVLPIILNIWAMTSENISEDEMDKFIETLDKIRENLINKTTLQL